MVCTPIFSFAIVFVKQKLFPTRDVELLAKQAKPPHSTPAITKASNNKPSDASLQPLQEKPLVLTIPTASNNDADDDDDDWGVDSDDNKKPATPTTTTLELPPTKPIVIDVAPLDLSKKLSTLNDNSTNKVKDENVEEDEDDWGVDGDDEETDAQQAKIKLSLTSPRFSPVQKQRSIGDMPKTTTTKTVETNKHKDDDDDWGSNDDAPAKLSLQQQDLGLSFSSF